MKKRHKKLAFILAGLVGFGAATLLVMNAFQDNLVFFFSPTQLADGEAPKERSFRLGGLVEEGSLKREDDGLTVHFKITDNANTTEVIYTGILPDLFREGQGVVAQGKLGTGNVFLAEQVLAKHDETYMPPEVADALEKAEQANKLKQGTGEVQQ